MNKVLVTGLGVGTDFGVCSCCDLDFSWLVNNPSILVWADKIIITQKAWKVQTQGSDDKLSKAVNLILQIAYDNNLIEISDPTKIFDSKIGDNIYSEVVNDMNRLTKAFPENIVIGDTKHVPNQLLINGHSFCGPYVASVYAGLKLSEELQANCLLNEMSYEYLKFRFGLAQSENYMIPQIMDEVFSVFLPNEPVLPEYACTPDKKCKTCDHEDHCRDSYLFDIEKRTNDLIRLRNFEEILIAREEIEKIIASKQIYGKEINASDIKREFTKRQDKINYNIKMLFPKIKRWTNLTTIIATPLSIYGAATGNPALTITGSGALGMAKIAEEAMERYKNKNNWVGFINKNFPSCKKTPERV